MATSLLCTYRHDVSYFFCAQMMATTAPMVCVNKGAAWARFSNITSDNLLPLRGGCATPLPWKPLCSVLSTGESKFISQISLEEWLFVLWCACGSSVVLTPGWTVEFVNELEREWPCCLLKQVGREGESSGWDSSSSPVTIRIVAEDSRELLREWKMKNEFWCTSLIPTSTITECSLTCCPTEMTFVAVPFAPSNSDLCGGLWTGMGELPLATNSGSLEIPLENECLLEVSLSKLGGTTLSLYSKSSGPSSSQTRTSMLLDFRIWPVGGKWSGSLVNGCGNRWSSKFAVWQGGLVGRLQMGGSMVRGRVCWGEEREGVGDLS